MQRVEDIDFGASEDERDVREMKKQILSHELHELVSLQMHPANSLLVSKVSNQF